MEIEQWNRLVGDMIAAIDTPDFVEALPRALRLIAGFDFTVMFAYSGDARPLDLHDDFPAGKRRVFVTDYQEGPYLLDPFFLACAGGVKPDLYRLKDLAPDRFYQGEYFRSYYVQTGLAEEIGYFIDLPGSVMVVISLMRSDASSAFTAREFRMLRSAEPIVRAAAQRHWRDLSAQFDGGGRAPERASLQDHIDHAFRTFGKSVLTPREREVVEFTLKGHSAEAVGNILGISAGTVRIHRKNVYAKLRINSQGELFSQFIGALISGNAEV